MPRPPSRPPGDPTTRERILDVALELFVAQGYEGTSLREIAERMKFSKAALYYHFPSKDDILLALHMRLHALGHEGFGDFTARFTDPAAWPEMLDRLVDKVIDNRALFILHTRNQAAITKLHQRDEAHDADHQNLEHQLRAVLADPAIPTAQRLRLVSALGAVGSALLLAGDMLRDIDDTDLRAMLRDVVRDLIRPAAITADRQPAASPV